MENLRVMTGPQQTSYAASHNIDYCFLFDPNEVEAQLESQLEVTACGPTAVVNDLRIMGYQVKPYFVARRVAFRQRDSLAPLPEYLMSRSVAGYTHEDLIRRIENATQGEVSNRFFSFHTPREVCLRHWLINWMKKGYVPVLTLNEAFLVTKAKRGRICGRKWFLFQLRTHRLLGIPNIPIMRLQEGTKGTQWMKQEQLSPPPASLVIYQRPAFSSATKVTSSIPNSSSHPTLNPSRTNSLTLKPSWPAPPKICPMYPKCSTTQ